ncbi:4'-phosphopantetheinyl transferase [methanogenic archaeon mixed culture ISO4-G1]|nr:4'-phosphopantetheinyl transferase [methanogenic archaeon mixed culture ISO4-G1]
MPLTVKTVTYCADTAPLNDRELYGRFYLEMPDYRRSKIDYLAFDKDRIQSMGVEILLRRALEDHGVDYRSLDISTGRYGKPYFNGCGLCFNLSHSEERVMCSVSEDDVGCDVEKVHTIDLGIARRYFFGSEYETICSEKDLERKYDLFFRFWTLKESFMKATGLGFELPLDSFRIELGDRITVDQKVDGRDYRFMEYTLSDGYRYAVCSPDGSFEPTIRNIDLRGC